MTVGPIHSSHQVYWAWIRCFLLSALMIPGTLYAAVLALDPYSSGRLTPFKKVYIATDDARFANVGRARDPQFTAAIIGNSRMMRLSPEQLDGLTSLRFVSLAMPGVGPAEQIATVRAFIRHHPGEVVVVWGLSNEWCEVQPPTTPFPFWLYDESVVGYLRNILSQDSVRATQRKFKMLVGWSQAKSTADGYEPRHPYWLKATHPDPNMTPPADGPSPDAPMPGVLALQRFTSALPSSVRTIFVIPPIYAKALPLAGSIAHMRMDVCKEKLRLIATELRAPFLDLLKSTPDNINPRNFVDAGHFRDNIARDVERLIAEVARP